MTFRFIILTGLLIFYCYSFAEGDGWKPLSKYEEGFWYDEERITYSASDNVRVWTWQRDTQILYQIKCSTKQLKVLYTIKYNAKGNVLFSYSFSFPNWKSIARGSIEEKLYNVVCKIT
jgi:hypothetical protein